MAIKTRWILFGVSTVLALSLVAAFTVHGATTAQITTSQKLYSVGQTMVINGTGFTPGAYIYLTVQRPDKLTDSVSPQPFTDGTGAFSASYTPPLEPGHYVITATDGSNTATIAVTEADAIAFNKGVYNKGAIAPEDTTGTWTTGNAGKNYLENQWAFYQYQITGVGSTVPSFDVVFNHFQSNTKAVFIDALADFRACVDCTDSSFTTGNTPGMLLNTVPLPPSSTANWVLAASAVSHINRPLYSTASGTGGAVVLTGQTGFCSSDQKEPLPDLVTTFPAEQHCFHVDGPTLGALFGSTLSQGTHTITLYYAAHLAASFVWGNGTAGVGGHEGSIGDCNSPYYVRPLTGPLASFEPLLGGLDPCAGHPQVYGTDDYANWTAAGFGVGFATGSSRQFQMTNQSAGPNGAITLPIPTVAAPANTIIIRKVTVPSNATGVTFPFTSSQLGGFSLTSPFPSSHTFAGIAAGVEYDVTESSVAGWNLNNVACAVTAGTDDGTGTWPTSGTNPTAAITLGATDSNVTLTCTYTNAGAGHIIVQKHTNPTPDTTDSFSYTTTGSGYTGFSLKDGGSNTDGGSAPAGGLQSGSYSVTETALSGFVLTSLSCSTTVTGSGTSSSSISGATANITLGAGDTVTCVYNNSKPDANVSITPLNPVNEIGNAETFTITVNAIPNGASPVVFSSITPSVTPTAGLTSNTNTCNAPTISNGGNTATCTLTINSTTVGSYTAHVAATVTIGGVALNRATGDSNTGDSADAVKHYVDANITIGPPTATNEVNAAHTFNIVVTALPDGTGTPTFGAVTATVTPAPSTLGAVTCSAPVGNVENCTLTINSTTAGTFTANACTTVTMGGVAVSRCTNDAHLGDVGPAVKHYIQSATTLAFNSALSTPNTKTGGNVAVGSTVTVVVTETNTGSGTIHGVTVTGSPCATWTAPGGFSGSLAAGASANFTCTFTAVAGTNSWSAQGNGIDSLNNPVPTTGETDAGSLTGLTTSTSLTLKSSTPADGSNAAVGSTATIVVTETNTGTASLTGVNVTGGGKCATFSGGATTLAAGASTDFTCTFTVVAGANAWFADGHGTDQFGTPAPSAGEHTAGSLTGLTTSTSLTLKSSTPADGSNAAVGSTATIVVTETNTGTASLTGVNVTGGGKCATFTGGSTTLAAGASTDFTCTFTVTAGANSWFADGHGTDQFGAPAPSTGEHASGSLTGLTTSTSLVTKSAPASIEFGNLVTIVVTETNTGTASLSGVNVTGGGMCASFTGGATTLAPGASTDFTCTFTAVLGANAWFADGHGTDQFGAPAPATGEHASGTVTGLGSYIVVNKISHSGTATFDFTPTGFSFPGGTNSLTTVAGALGTTAPSGGATTGPILVHTGEYSVGEPTQPPSWQLDASICTVDGTNPFGTPTVVGGVNVSWDFIIPLNTTVTCTFDDSIVLQTTRTQGFWATHTTLANTVWNGGTIPSGPVANPVINPADPSVVGSPDSYLCGVQITAVPTTAENVLMGGFWAQISKTSSGSKRTSIDQGRMQMLQQYLAAVLNYHLFGSIGESVLAQARTAYCGTDAKAIQNEIGILSTLNQQGDTQAFTPGVSATSQLSKAQADIDAWDTPTHPVD